MQSLSNENNPLSTVIAPFYKYFKSAEKNIELADREKIEGIIKQVKEKYQDGKQDDLDGITVGYADWWFNVRPSNTEPLLRLNIEAKTPELLEEKKKELTEFIVSI